MGGLPEMWNTYCRMHKYPVEHVQQLSCAELLHIALLNPEWESLCHTTKPFKYYQNTW